MWGLFYSSLLLEVAESFSRWGGEWGGPFFGTSAGSWLLKISPICRTRLRLSNVQILATDKYGLEETHEWVCILNLGVGVDPKLVCVTRSRSLMLCHPSTKSQVIFMYRWAWSYSQRRWLITFPIMVNTFSIDQLIPWWIGYHSVNLLIQELEVGCDWEESLRRTRLSTRQLAESIASVRTLT